MDCEKSDAKPWLTKGRNDKATKAALKQHRTSAARAALELRQRAESPPAEDLATKKAFRAKCNITVRFIKMVSWLICVIADAALLIQSLENKNLELRRRLEASVQQCSQGSLVGVNSAPMDLITRADDFGPAETVTAAPSLCLQLSGEQGVGTNMCQRRQHGRLQSGAFVLLLTSWD